ncbi:MAG TPA: ABC transporter substrate-binding protein [Xanthobacteraceae bacterium]|nr:ABC transporter substrate-binding protein [Xanthobacteraceae bacterium]
MGAPASRPSRLAVFLGGALVIAGAFMLSLGGPQSRAQTNNVVKLASAGIASDIGFFIAEKKGYFKAEGLDVQLTTLANSPQMIGPLGMGQLDVGAGTVAASLYNAVSQGVTIRAVADKGSMRPGYGFSGLLVRKDLVDSGRYKSYKDLKGMTIAVGTFGSANSSAVNEALKRGGLTWDDAHMVALTFPQHLAAFANKAIDASMTNEPTASEAVKEGLAVRIAGNDEIYPDQQTAVVLYAETFARQRPQLALRFMRAYIKAIREYNDALKDGKIAGPNADEVISLLTENTFIKDPQVNRDITPPAIDPDGKMNVAGLRNDLQFFKERKLIQDPKITVDRIVDTLYASAAVKELGPYQRRDN